MIVTITKAPFDLETLFKTKKENNSIVFKFPYLINV